MLYTRPRESGNGGGGPARPAPLLRVTVARRFPLLYCVKEQDGRSSFLQERQKRRRQQPLLPGGARGAGGGEGEDEGGRNGGANRRGGAVVSPAGLRGPLPGLLPLLGAERPCRGGRRRGGGGLRRRCICGCRRRRRRQGVTGCWAPSVDSRLSSPLLVDF